MESPSIILTGLFWVRLCPDPTHQVGTPTPASQVSHCFINDDTSFKAFLYLFLIVFICFDMVQRLLIIAHPWIPGVWLGTRIFQLVSWPTFASDFTTATSNGRWSFAPCCCHWWSFAQLHRHLLETSKQNIKGRVEISWSMDVHSSSPKNVIYGRYWSMAKWGSTLQSLRWNADGVHDSCVWVSPKQDKGCKYTSIIFRIANEPSNSRIF